MSHQLGANGHLHHNGFWLINDYWHPEVYFGCFFYASALKRQSGIAPVLRQMGVTVMLAGNMGQGARNVLEAQRIEVIRGCSGDVEGLVAAYLAGNVKDNGESCDHHDCH